MKIYKGAGDKNTFILNVDAAEYDEILGGLYFLDKEGKASGLMTMNMADSMQHVLEHLSEYDSAYVAITPAGGMPKSHLTPTQRQEVQKMIHDYALEVEKRRAAISKKYQDIIKLHAENTGEKLPPEADVDFLI